MAMMLKDKFGFDIGVDDDYIEKISFKMPPISLTILSTILKVPDEVLVSNQSQSKRCYYKKIDGELYKAVVKYLSESKEHWLNTAHKTDAKREKEVFDENSIQ